MITFRAVNCKMSNMCSLISPFTKSGLILLIFPGQKRSKVYFDVSADGVPLGRINMELFNEVVPRTAENFRQIATGEAGFSYTGSKFHRVIPNFMLQVNIEQSKTILHFNFS